MLQETKVQKLCAIGLSLLTCLGMKGAVVQAPPSAENQPLSLVQRIPVPTNVEGDFDHLGVDVKGGRLFIAGPDSGSVEVVDLRAGKWVRSIPGFKEPQGVWYVGEFNKLFVANRNDGKLSVLQGDSLELVDTVQLALGPDRLSYDPVSKNLYVGYGGKDAKQDYGLVGIVDTKTNKHVGDVKVLAHPAEVLLEMSNPKIFVAISTADLVEVIDRQKRKVLSKWQVPEASHPADMDLDKASHRLFIVGSSKHLTVLDSDSGKVVANLPCVDDADGVFFDAAHKRIYVTGDGFLDVFKEIDADHYESIARIPTGAGAGTSLLVTEVGRFFVAVPHHGKQAAEIQVYQIQP